MLFTTSKISPILGINSSIPIILINGCWFKWIFVIGFAFTSAMLTTLQQVHFRVKSNILSVLAWVQVLVRNTANMGLPNRFWKFLIAYHNFIFFELPMHEGIECQLHISEYNIISCGFHNSSFLLDLKPNSSVFQRERYPPHVRDNDSWVIMPHLSA